MIEQDGHGGDGYATNGNGHSRNGNNGHHDELFDWIEPKTNGSGDGLSGDDAGDADDELDSLDPTAAPLPDGEGERVIRRGETELLMPLRIVKNWKPTKRQLTIYDVLCWTGDIEFVAKKFRTSIHQVEVLCRQIDQWVKSQHLDEIWSIRVRQQKYLENLYKRALIGFEASKEDEVTEEEGDGPKGSTSKTKRRHRGEGNPNWLMLAREILSDIRKLTGADKSPLGADSGNTFSVSQYNSRKDAIEARIRLLESVKASLAAE